MREHGRIQVCLGSRSYTVHIGTGLLPFSAKYLAESGLTGRCAIVSDSNVAPLYAASVHEAVEANFTCDLVEVPAGENSKSLAQCESICRQLVAMGHDRSSFLIALGGGVVGDLTGFVAAIFLRGVPYVQIPTTIVSQVDSAVGGKTGVNLPEGKNLVGAFHQPRVVIADVATLDSLPRREFNEGLAEVIKHAVIRDAALFDELFAFDRSQLAKIIARNVEIKAAIVAADEHETSGERALLNFGHTLGHAIESAAGYGSFLHGEAIALGMIAAGRLSIQFAQFPVDQFRRLVQLIQKFDLPTILPPEVPDEAILHAMQADKKFVSGKMRFVLCRQIGSAYVSSAVTRDDVIRAVAQLRENPLS